MIFGFWWQYLYKRLVMYVLENGNVSCLCSVQNVCSEFWCIKNIPWNTAPEFFLQFLSSARCPSVVKKTLSELSKNDFTLYYLQLQNKMVCQSNKHALNHLAPYSLSAHTKTLSITNLDHPIIAEKWH